MRQYPSIAKKLHGVIYKALFKVLRHAPVWLDAVEYGVPENAMWLVKAALLSQ